MWEVDFLSFLSKQAIAELENAYQIIKDFLQSHPKELSLEKLQKIIEFLEGKRKLSLEEVLSIQEDFSRLKEIQKKMTFSLHDSSNTPYPYTQKLLLLARSKAKYVEDQPLTATEVAALSNTTLPNIILLANKGLLKGKKQGKEWHFPKKIVKEYLEKLGKLKRS